MKTTWDELMRYAPEQEIPLPPMQDGEGARILSKTMGKIKETKRKPARPVRTVLIAAAIAALLCGSAFAAHSFGWFDRLFGEKAALVKEHVTSYDETTTTDITQPAYTEEEQAMIAEGTMQVPDTADLADTGVSAALPEADGYQQELERMLRVGVRNNTGFGTDHRLEWKNGGVKMEIIQVDGSTAYAVVTNVGGEFEPGDRLLFRASYHDQSADLFELPVPEQLEQELVIELDGDPSWKTATITPISFRLDGIDSSQSSNSVTVTLKDGTRFNLASKENNYADSAYGTYGSMSHSASWMYDSDHCKETWLFSQLIDLDELASITVCGVTYPI